MKYKTAGQPRSSQAYCVNGTAYVAVNVWAHALD
jgi:hypothetical protein